MSATLKLSGYLVRQAACLDESEAITLDCSPEVLRGMALAALAERDDLRDKLERAESLTVWKVLGWVGQLESNDALAIELMRLLKKQFTAKRDELKAKLERAEATLKRVRKEVHKQGPHHSPGPDGCPHFCSGCSPRRKIRDAILAAMRDPEGET